MKRTAILANGDFPREGGVAWNILANAERVVACDGAADAYFAHFQKYPALIVGDLDSFSPSTSSAGASSPSCGGASSPSCGGAFSPSSTGASSPSCGGAFLRRIPEQDTNDLAKAVMVCRENGWTAPVILGATGKRDDHTLGNIMRAFDFGLEIVTDYGRFVPITTSAKFEVKPGSPISIFAPDPTTRATSRGLEWPLDNVIFQNLYCATLNRATGSIVEITADKMIFAYLPFE